MRRSQWGVLAVCLFLLAAAPAPGAGQADGDTDTRRVAGTQVDADDVLMRVHLHANGTASWAIEYRIRLDDENTTEAFESIRADIRNDSTAFTEPFAERMAATAADAESATGREMAIRNVTVSAERRALPQEYGVVTYRFQWENFAVANGTGIRAGDALAGLFLDSDTRLLISWPSSYRLASVDPQPDDSRNDSVVWAGPADFADGEPSVVATTAPATGSGPLSGPGTYLLGAALLALAGVAYVYRVRGAGVESDDGDDGTVAVPDGDAGGGADEADGGAGEADEPPEELLSNEERVLRLVRERGGRMKQQEVAGELGWTDAKTSQVLKGLREEGQLEAFRLGRENVISLPGTDGDDPDSQW